MPGLTILQVQEVLCDRISSELQGKWIEEAARQIRGFICRNLFHGLPSFKKYICLDLDRFGKLNSFSYNSTKRIPDLGKPALETPA